MATAHNSAQVGEIASSVIMSGNPNRVKYIVKEFLSDSKLVSNVRDIPCFTGMYKGKKISVMASGMGISSMGIYSYELFKFYNVEKIVRVGTCGSISQDLKMLDVVLTENSYSGSGYAFAMSGEECHIVPSDDELNQAILSAARNKKTSLVRGDTLCNEVFDPYAMNEEKFLSSLPKELNLVNAEMESFSLFYNAKLLGKKAACLALVVNPISSAEVASPEQSKPMVDSMVQIALEAI